MPFNTPDDEKLESLFDAVFALRSFRRYQSTMTPQADSAQTEEDFLRRIADAAEPFRPVAG